MTTPPDPSRGAAPSAREIAELTARLRDISALGRDVDPAERAAFLADKNALIARITQTADTDTDRARRYGSAVSFDQAVYYSDADIAAIADAIAAGNTGRAQHLQDRPWLAQSAPVDTAHADITEDQTFAEAEQLQERREQLGRWHDDDHPTDVTSVEDVDGDVEESRVVLIVYVSAAATSEVWALIAVSSRAHQPRARVWP